MSEKNKNEEFDFKFAASLFLNGEYAIRHLFLIDESRTIQNTLNAFKDALFNKIKIKNNCEQLILQALIDYTLYIHPDISSPAFSKLYWKRYITKCNNADFHEEDIEYSYNELTKAKDDNDNLLKICKLSMNYGFYITDTLFFKKRKFNLDNVCTTWMVDNHINQLPKYDILKNINNSISFLDESDAFGDFENLKDTEGHIFILNFDDTNFDISSALDSIKLIYCFYKIDDALLDKTLHKTFDIDAARKILPKILERTNKEEIFIKMIAIEICDYISTNNPTPEEAINAYYNDNKNKSDYPDNDIMPAVKLAIKSIKKGKLCTSKDK